MRSCLPDCSMVFMAFSERVLKPGYFVEMKPLVVSHTEHYLKTEQSWAGDRPFGSRSSG
jgi:hypothetical protein